MQNLKKRLNKRKGFTLIELIVVIAILGILAMIAVPRITGFQNKARIAADQATFDTINKSIAIAVADGTITGNVTLTTSSSGVVTFTGADTTQTTAITALFEQTPVFKLSGNQSLTNIIWTIDSDGKITPPLCNSTSGLVTAHS